MKTDSPRIVNLYVTSSGGPIHNPHYLWFYQFPGQRQKSAFPLSPERPAQLIHTKTARRLSRNTGFRSSSRQPEEATVTECDSCASNPASRTRLKAPSAIPNLYLA